MISSRAFGLVLSSLHSVSSSQFLAFSRKNQYIEDVVPGIAMARKLFRRSPVTIAEAIRKLEGLLRTNKSLEETLKRMRDSLVKGRKGKYRVSVA